MTLHNTLTQMKARSLPAGRYADGQGLWLIKHRQEAGRWMLRMVVFGKRREMGLGSWPDVTIAEARGRAAAARRRLRDGVDPIEERKRKHRRSRRLTIDEAVAACFEARQADLKSDGKAGHWLSPSLSMSSRKSAPWP